MSWFPWSVRPFRARHCEAERIAINICNRLLEMETRIMSTLAEFQAVLAAIDTTTNDIAARIDALIAKIAAGGMTAVEEQTVLDALTAESAKLKLLASDPANPVPPPAPPAA